jgi:histidinol-phosphate aminotransferase
VVLGAGSGEILRNAVRAYTSAARPLVTASPSFETPERLAEKLGIPVRRVPVDSAGRLDIDGMVTAATGAGLLFFCNPNNPTATVHGAKAVADLVARVRRASPETAILIDEAYHDYVTDPAYQTAIPLALAEPHVFVTRTFSKAYGMAGLRIGYAVGQAATIATLGRWTLTFNQNAPGVAAAMAALEHPEYIEAERRRNTEVRDFTLKFFRTAGFKATESQGNFIFVEIGRPAAAFRDACREQHVLVGRPFPPLDQRHVRISIGTMEEMRRATAVFAKVLGVTTTSAAR